MIRQGLFREDLYYRLNVVPIRLPPLRERVDDIGDLVQHFLRSGQREGEPVKTIAPDAIRLMQNYSWPGNVRELENLIERAVILAEGETLSSSDFHDGSSAEPPQPRHAAALSDEALERELPVEKYIEAFVRRYQERHSDAELAAMLGIGRKALWVRRHKWKLFRAGSRLGRADSGRRKAAV
jgi:two-component system nitrogen regulation response regulator GlnG